MTTLVNLSGGLDSVYVTWKYLTQNTDRLLIHHIYLKSPEAKQRWKKEEEAVKNVLTYFKNHGLTHFDYVESVFDYQQFGYTVRDYKITFFLIGVLLNSKKGRNIKTILMPYTKNDLKNGIDPSYDIKQEAIKQNYVFVPEFKYVIKELTRKELINELPADLFKLCWYCRRPSSNGTPCGKCYTCKNTITV